MHFYFSYLLIFAKVELLFVILHWFFPAASGQHLVHSVFFRDIRSCYAEEGSLAFLVGILPFWERASSVKARIRMSAI